MKTIFSLAALIFWATICSSQVKFSVDPEAEQYENHFVRAIQNPDSAFFINKIEKTVKITGFFENDVKIVERGICFDSKQNKIIFIEKEEEKEKKDSLLFLFGILSIIMIIISDNLLLKYKNWALFFSFSGYIFVFLFAAQGLLLFSEHLYLLAASFIIAGLVTATTIETKENEYKRSHKIFVYLFYTIMTVYFLLMIL